MLHVGTKRPDGPAPTPSTEVAELAYIPHTSVQLLCMHLQFVIRIDRKLNFAASLPLPLVIFTSSSSREQRHPRSDYPVQFIHKRSSSVISKVLDSSAPLPLAASPRLESRE